MKFFQFIAIALLVFCSQPVLADKVIYQDAEYKEALEQAKQVAKKLKNKKENKDKNSTQAPANNEPTGSRDSSGRIVNYNDSDIDNTVEAHERSQISANSLSDAAQVKEDCDFDGSICIYSYVYEDKIVLEALNKTPASRTIIMGYSLSNMRSSRATKNIILKSHERKVFDTLYPVDRGQSYGYNYTYKSYFGVIDAVHDGSYEYDLPFDINQKFIVIQSVGGRFSHSDEVNYYAYDFKMPIGTAVLAAREGMVVRVVDGYKEGGINTSLKRKANYVYVQHSDGTIATYNHIKYKGSMVKVGDYVQKGQKIAFSGNIGYTNVPHLHFSVFKVVRDGKFKSVPIRIKTKNGVLNQLKAGDFVEK